MKWLINSSIGRKVVMSVTGIALVLFLLFHALMNVVVIINEDAYNAICAFLGANWYALIATVGLAGLMAIHILYAFWLTLQNYRARGSQRYAVSGKQADVEWSSKNMLVLGVIVLGFIFVHLYHFWFKMQFQEILVLSGVEISHDLHANVTNGVMYIRELFAQPLVSVIYIVWLAAIWYHLTHGVWSALHSIGLNNNTWMPRVKCIANIISTIVVLLFAAVVVWYQVIAIINGTVNCGLC